MRDLGPRLRSWEGMLLAILLVVVALNTLAAPGYLTIQNQINLFELSVEKAIVVLVMTFVIIGGEIDLSVASVGTTLSRARRRLMEAYESLQQERSAERA